MVCSTTYVCTTRLSKLSAKPEDRQHGRLLLQSPTWQLFCHVILPCSGLLLQSGLVMTKYLLGNLVRYKEGFATMRPGFGGLHTK